MSDTSWRSIAAFVGRLIFAGVFAMAVSFKFMGMGETAGYIAAAGFPFPTLLAWLAALFELALVIGFLTGAFFSEAALLAAAYVIFLAFSLSRPVALGGQPGRVRLLRRSLQLLRGTALRRRPRAGRPVAAAPEHPRPSLKRPRSNGSDPVRLVGG